MRALLLSTARRQALVADVPGFATRGFSTDNGTPYPSDEDRPMRGTLIVLICAAFVTGPAVADEVTRLSEPVVVTDTHETFGAALPESLATVGLGEIVQQAEQHLDKNVAVRTRIAKVCQKKGCFFVATDGAFSARVTFKDYGFFIPTDAGGKTVDLVGTFDRRALSRRDAKHFAKDLGEDVPASPPEFEYVIVAEAVRIPR